MSETAFTGLDPDLRRPGVVYGFWILDPTSGQVRVDYVGQTFQRLAAREAQHRETQPWSDLIVGPAFIIESGCWTQAELDELEAFHIRRLLPRYNYEFNLDNAERIPIWLAQEQRAERDAARGIVRTPLHPVRVSRPRPARMRPRARRRIPIAVWSAGWLLAAGVLWAAVPRSVPAMVGGGWATLAATAVVGGVMWLRRR